MTDSGGRVNAQAWTAPSGLAGRVRAAQADWERSGGSRRLWDKDASLWTGGDEAKWLG